MIRIGLIEDVEAIRKGQEKYFNAQADIEMVISASSIEDFITILRNTSKPPDIVISDIGLPGASGIEGVMKIKKIFPRIEFMMVSVYTDTDNIYKALCAGAVGYMVKNTPLSELKEALYTIKDGGSPMTPSIARKVIAHFSPTKPKDENLTLKEQQIVQCIVDGMSYKLIADRLSISINTVRHHIRHIYKKLQVNSKAEVIALAYNKFS